MFKLFGNAKNSVKSPKILICFVGDAMENANFQQEKSIYQMYQDVTEYRAAAGADLLAFVDGKTYDIVHLLASVADDGTVGGSFGIQVLEGLSKAGAKLVVFASENPVENYVAAFPPKQRIGFVEPNLVLTLERKGENFVKFFGSLFGLMAKGRTMPMAWVKMAPQGGDSRRMQELPETIFEANLGQIKFVP